MRFKKYLSSTRLTSSTLKTSEPSKNQRKSVFTLRKCFCFLIKTFADILFNSLTKVLHGQLRPASLITDSRNSLLSKYNLLSHANTCATKHVQFARDKSNGMVTVISTDALLVGLLLKESFSHNYLYFGSKCLINAFM